MELSASAKWIIRIINSCKTPLQMELCDNLKKNYLVMYNDEHLKEIEEAFEKKALQTNYWQHKEINKRESHG